MSKTKASNMGKSKKNGWKATSKKLGKRASKAKVKATAGISAKLRHMRDRRGNLHVWNAQPLPTHLIAKPTVAQPKSKHRSYFEFVENSNKRKKLEFQVTTDRRPPPGYEFVPSGNPELTAACKELSREKDAMIFIVSSYTGSSIAPELGLALNRVGHHIREAIVEEARASLGDTGDVTQRKNPDIPEPIPEDQEEINKQADAAIRDLFPRIPNTDRQTIIERSFKKGATMPDGKTLVGLAPDLTLARRVQLAVVSHIRHAHTRYDDLLRETSYPNARRVVEKLCLDILVKWRGDEENGRDQLDEILREVVVISDSEEEDYDDDEEDDDEDDSEDTEMTSGESSDEATKSAAGLSPRLAEKRPPATANGLQTNGAATTNGGPSNCDLVEAESARTAAKRAQRGFQRYQAAWQQAVDRQRLGHNRTPSGPMPLQRLREPGVYRPPHGAEPDSRPGPSSHVPENSNGYGPYPPGVQRQTAPSHAYGNSSDHVNPRSQTPLYYYDRGAGYRNGDRDGNGYEPRVGSRPIFASSPGVRTAVSRPAQEDLRDYLVPSIEPTSPLASQFSAQTLSDRRQVQGPDSWPARPALQCGDAAPRYASPHVLDEGFIQVHRHADGVRHAEMMPSEYRDVLPADGVGVRDDGRIRSVVYEPVSQTTNAGPNASYHQSSSAAFSRDHYVAADGAYSRPEDPRPTVAPDQPYRYGAAPESRWHQAVPHDGNGARFREASRPSVVEDDRTWREPYLSRPGQVHVGAQLEPLVIQRPAPSGRELYNGHRVFRPADPYTGAVDADHHLPLDFIPVSNMFPRPHGHAAMREEPQTYHDPYPREARRDEPSLDRASGNGYDHRHQRPTPDLRANLPTRERVVRYEYVNHGHFDEAQAHRVYDREMYRRQDPLAVGIAAVTTYSAPSIQRSSRQDGVIYLE